MLALLCALACAATPAALAQSSTRDSASRAASSARADSATSGADSATSGVCQVSSSADAGAGSLRAALADPACTTIVIAAGTTVALRSQLVVDRSVAIACNVAAAGGMSDMWSSMGGGGAAALECIIDGASSTRLFVVPQAIPPGLQLTLTGLTLRNGAVGSNLTTSPFGGALYVRPAGAVVTVLGCKFFNNQALLGGAIRTRNIVDTSVPGISLTVRDSVFENNTAESGGAISTGTRAVFELERSAFARNAVQALIGQFSLGGALSCGGTQLRMKDCTFDGNTAGDAGGTHARSHGICAICLCSRAPRRIALQQAPCPSFPTARATLRRCSRSTSKRRALRCRPRT